MLFRSVFFRIIQLCNREKISCDSANPRLLGISETEETLLYAKLNEYNRGRISFKKAGAYLIVLPRSGHSNYSLWVYSPEPEKQSILFIHDLSPDIYEALRMASTMFYFSKRCLLIVDYNLKRMQSNGDDLIPFGSWHLTRFLAWAFACKPDDYPVC